MPISCPIQVRPISQAEFKKLDYEVMRHAFASQNDLGRLCDEAIYQADLALRLEGAGLGPVRTEVLVTVFHGDFRKTYFIDVLLIDAAPYELKTVSALNTDHQKQLLHYLFLLGVQHGKLLNFRPPTVEHRFVNTTLTHESRHQFTIEDGRWHAVNERSALLREVLEALLKDWGAFLELSLYLEALTFFLGGEATVLRALPIMRDGHSLGEQRVHLLTPESGFRLTAMTEDAAAYEAQLA